MPGTLLGNRDVTVKKADKVFHEAHILGVGGGDDSK